MKDHIKNIIPMLVKLEVERARRKHDPINTLHHGYGVLMEEVEEFWDEVKKQKPESVEVLKELVQVGAVAQRIAEDYFTEEDLTHFVNICRPL